MAKPVLYDCNEAEPDRANRKGFYAYIFQGAESMTFHYSTCFDETTPNVHSHDYEQVIFVIEGNCIWEIDGVEYETPKGSFMVIPPNAVHNFARKIDCDECKFLEIMNPKIVDRQPSPRIKNLGHKNWD